MKTILEYIVNNHVQKSYASTPDNIYVDIPFSFEEYALQNKCTEIEIHSIKCISKFLKGSKTDNKGALNLLFDDGLTLHVYKHIDSHYIYMKFMITKSKDWPANFDEDAIANDDKDIHWQSFDDRETQNKLFLLFNKFLKENYTILL